MLIRVSDHAAAADLCHHFQRSGFVAESVGGGMIEVSQPEAGGPVAERQAVLAHLAVWRVANPGSEAEVVPGG